MFINATALFALGLLALPVAIHLLARMSGPRMRFASVRFVPRSVAPRFRFLRVHRWPLLLMRLLVCGLLVLAIAGPVFVNEEQRLRCVLILIDESLSMNGQEIRENVLREAREQVASLAKKDRVGVACFDRSARMLCDFTTDRALVEQAISSYTPGYSEADFNAAIMWADERLNSQPFSRRLILITDLQATNVASFRPVELKCDLSIIRVERSDQANASLDTVAFGSFGGRVELASALLISENDRTRIKPVSLIAGPPEGGSDAAASNSTASVSLRRVGDGVIAGRLTTGAADGFEADDDRFFAARAPAEASTLIVQPPVSTAAHAGYVEKALRASLYQVSDVNPARVSERLPPGPDSLRRYRAVICPARAIDKNSIDAVREYAREGGLMIVTLGVEDGDLPEHLIEGASIASLDQPQSTGLLPPLDSGGDDLSVEQGLLAPYTAVRFRAARRIGVSEGEVALRYSNGEIAAARVQIGRGSLMLLGFGLSGEDASLARSPVFPEFVEWLVRGAGRSESVLEFTSGQVPAARLLGDAQRLTRIYSSAGPGLDEEIAVAAGSLHEPGVYRVERASGETVLAINAPASESRLAQASEQSLLDRVITKNESNPSSARGEYYQEEQRLPLWWILAAAALALSLIELVYCSEWRLKSARKL
jgi:hypothetical protein